MRNETRVAFNAYLAHVATLNGVATPTHKFNVAPSIEQVLEDRIREQAEFLGQVNVQPVGQQTGEKLGLGIGSPVAGRTNTATTDRTPRNVAAFDDQGYACVQTNFDTFVRYEQLDAWAKFPDFQTRLRNQITQQVGRDRLMIGWHGELAAQTTDLAANPMLQDVNVGWLKHIRTRSPQRVLTGAKVGAGGDYASYDAAVFDAMGELLDDWHRESPDLVVIVGRQLLNDKYLALVNSADAPTEHQALSNLLLSRTMGGRRAITVPYFPAKSILITAPSNLSIYWQNGTRRRMVQDNPKRDRIEDYMSVNEAYVVEDYGKCALLDGILTPDGAGGWA